jgi:hypothetical protein
MKNANLKVTKNKYDPAQIMAGIFSLNGLHFLRTYYG